MTFRCLVGHPISLPCGFVLHVGVKVAKQLATHKIEHYSQDLQEKQIQQLSYAHKRCVTVCWFTDSKLSRN